eukprot:725117_1
MQIAWMVSVGRSHILERNHIIGLGTQTAQRVLRVGRQTQGVAVERGHIEAREADVFRVHAGHSAILTTFRPTGWSHRRRYSPRMVTSFEAEISRSSSIRNCIISETGRIFRIAESDPNVEEVVLTAGGVME